MFAKTSQYALRLMFCVARHEGPTPLRSADLAELSSVPPAYVSKIMKRLEDAGLVTSKKGWGGGFWLARPPSAIRLADILAAVEEHAMGERSCVFGWGTCSSADPCPLHHTWTLLAADVTRWGEHTLEDVLAAGAAR